MTAEEELAILKKKIADDREYKRKEATQTAEENWRKADSDISTSKTLLWFGAVAIILGFAALMKGEYGWEFCILIGIGILLHCANTISKANRSIMYSRAQLRTSDPDNYRFTIEKQLSKSSTQDE